MDLNQLKIELIQKIISCEDENILRTIKQILDENPSEVKEEGEKYSIKPSAELDREFPYEQEDGFLNINEEQEEELLRRYQDHLEGGGRSLSWEEVRKNIHERHGF